MMTSPLQMATPDLIDPPPDPIHPRPADVHVPTLLPPLSSWPVTPPPSEDGRIPHGPQGLGTRSLRLAADPPPPQELEMHCPEPVRDDPELAAELNRRLAEWAENEVRMYPPELRPKFEEINLGEGIMLMHPDTDDIDRLMVAARMFAAENAVDDFICDTEAEYGGDPAAVGIDLALAQSAIDPAHLPSAYESDRDEGLTGHPAWRGMGSAMDYLNRMATPAQAHRFRHEIANLYLGYNAERSWIAQGRMPPVWEYLAVRQMNNFRPCPTLTDVVGGYELTDTVYADPRVQRLIALACNASTLVNDIYSFRKEKRSQELREDAACINLVSCLAAEEGCPVDEAFAKAVAVHNDYMHAFESEARAVLAALPDPVLARYLTGIWNWLGGNHRWHAHSSARFRD